MSLSVNARRSPRLADYFAIVSVADEIKAQGNPFGAPSLALGSSGSVNVASHPLSMVYPAKVVHRFPDWEHEDNAFPSNLALFCLPGGLRLRRVMELPTFFVFVHTRANGEHLYGYVFTFFEPLEGAQHDQAEAALARHREALATGTVTPVFGTVSSASAANGAVGGNPAPSDDVGPGGRWYAPVCLCLLSSWPYFTGFREFLTNLFRISLSPAQIPLERYICNFMLEVPCPVPGRIEVMYHMSAGGGTGPTVGTPTISFACPPPNKPVSWPSLPLEPLFRCLSHEHAVTIFEALLLERSVVLTSASLYLLTACAEALMALLYPLSWTHVYIPVLPEALMGVLAAPMPYLVGVRADYLQAASADVTHVILVDLDRDVVSVGVEQPPLMPLPPKRRAKLLAALAEHADVAYARTPEWRETLMGGADLAFPMAVRPFDFTEGMDAARAAAAPPDWDEVREAFLRVFTSLLKPYRRCLVFPTNADPSPRQLFLKEDFLERCDSDSRPFVAALLETQAMSSFIEARVPPDPDDRDVMFFDESIDAKLNRSKFSVVKRDTEFLRSSAFTKVKTVVALTPDVRGLENVKLLDKGGAFPQLSNVLYPPPRSLPNNTAHARTASGARPKHGRRRSGAAFRAQRANEEEMLLPPAATIHCVFILLFSPTVGREPAKTVAATALPAAAAGAAPPPPRQLPAAAAPAASSTSVATPFSHAPTGPAAAVTGQALGLTAPLNSAEIVPTQSLSSTAPGRSSVWHLRATSGNPGGAGAAGAAAAATPPPLPVRGLLRRRSSRANTSTPPPAEGGEGSRPGSAAGTPRRQSGLAATAATAATASSLVAAVGAIGAKEDEGSFQRTSSEGVERVEMDADGQSASPPLPPADQQQRRVSRNGGGGDGGGSSTEPGRRMSFTTAVSSMLYGRRADSLLELLRLEDGRQRHDGLWRMLTGPPPLPPRPAAAASTSTVDLSAAPGDDAATPAATPEDGSPRTSIPEDTSLDASTPAAGAPATAGTSAVQKAEAGGIVVGTVVAVGPALANRLSMGGAAGGQPGDKEERAQAAAAALRIVFEVVEGMRRGGLELEPAAYRSLVNACGRCGSSERAMQVVEMMLQAGIMPDAEVSRCLVDAFAMDETFGSRSASPFDLIDWAKFQPRPAQPRGLLAQALNGDGDNERRSPEATGFSFKKLMRRGPGTPGGGAGGAVRGGAASTQVTPPRPGDGKAAANGVVTPKADVSLTMQRQVLLGDCILADLFPGLKIDTEHETCPSCKRALSGRETRAGWQRDSNVYTTTCPGVVNGLPCGRKFVARFSVSCSDPAWEGSTGRGTPLWCEYLPPWVLRKEVQSLLVSYGIDFLCSPDFRLSKGATSTNSTIFWNLIVHFQQYSLPTAFLLAGPFTSAIVSKHVTA